MAVRWLAHFKTEKERVRNQPCNLFKKKLTIKPEIFALKVIFQEQRKNKHINQFSSVQSLSHSITSNCWQPLDLTGWKGLSRVFSNTTVQKHQFFGGSAFFIVQLSHPYMTTGKTIALTRCTFVGNIFHQTHKYFPLKIVLHSTRGTSQKEPACQCRRHET